MEINKFAIKIKELRKQKKLSLRACSVALDISPTYLVRLEDTLSLPPSSEVIRKMSDLFEFDFLELCELANNYLEVRGKLNVNTTRVPFPEEVPAFLARVSKFVKQQGDWAKMAQIVEDY